MEGEKVLVIFSQVDPCENLLGILIIFRAPNAKTED